MFQLKEEERVLFLSIAAGPLASSLVQESRRFLQHGSVSTYDHMLSVAYYSFWLCRRLSLRCQVSSLIRGALFHDLFLYDWHAKESWHRLHGFYHPQRALQNASGLCTLDRIEENIILSHMWPLTFLQVPRCREAILVCLVDKVCSLLETLHIDCRTATKLTIGTE